MSSLISNKIVPLSTAVVKVCVYSSYILARILLDAGSQAILITRNFVNHHSIRTIPSTEPTVLLGVNNKDTSSSKSRVLDSTVNLVLQSLFSEFQIAISADVIPAAIPYKVSKNLYSLPSPLSNLNLAETKLPYNSVDIVVGAEYYEFLIENERHFIEGLVLRNTKFGHVLSESFKSSLLSTKNYCGLSKIDVNVQLQQFWEVENHENEIADYNDEHSLVEKQFNEIYS